jgi:excisionase family DNA binding protein
VIRRLLNYPEGAPVTEASQEVGEEALRLLTVRQVADLLNCSAKTVYRRIWDSELEAVPFGARSLRVAPEALKEYKDRLRGRGAKPAAVSAAPPAA